MEVIVKKCPTETMAITGNAFLNPNAKGELEKVIPIEGNIKDDGGVLMLNGEHNVPFEFSDKVPIGYICCSAEHRRKFNLFINDKCRIVPV